MRELALLLRRPERILADLRAGHAIGRHMATATGIIIACGATYGAVLGMWRSPLLALYSAIKLPLVLLATSLLTAVLNWIVAARTGLPLRFSQSTALALHCLATASVVLASLAPIAWLFTVSLPPPTTDARTTHNLVYLTHTLLVGGAGLTGTALLRKALKAISPDRAVAARVYAAWIAAFALVGGEVAWILRPFVGSVFYPVRFLRADALDGNVYEFIITDIVPHLLHINGGLR